MSLQSYIESRPVPDLGILAVDKFMERANEAARASIDFLSDPLRFPHPEINQIVSLMRSMIDNNHAVIFGVDLAVANFVEIPHVEEDYSDHYDLLTVRMPADFIDRDPLYYLGSLVGAASKLRDIYS